MASQDPTIASRPSRPRARRWAHAVIGLVAVIGVLAMHGLTLNHDVAMPGMGAGHSSVTLHASASGHHPALAETLIVGASVVDAPLMMPADGGTSVAGQVLRAAPSPHVMATACLAFLTGLLLMGGARRLTARLRRGAHPSALRDEVAWFATAVRRPRPDLAELSVLRT